MDINKIIGLLEGLKEDSTDYIEHKMIVSKKNSETGRGEIYILIKDFEKTKEVFKDYIDEDNKKEFVLETVGGNFGGVHFYRKPLGKKRRGSFFLLCKPFFSKLEPGDVIYLQPAGPGKVKVTKEEPDRKKCEDSIRDLKVLEKCKSGAKKLLQLICN